MSESSRREFLGMTAAAGIGVSMALGAEKAEAAKPKGEYGHNAKPLTGGVRVGFVGTGLQGTGHVHNLTRIPGVKVVALCDIRERNVNRAADLVEKSGQPRPELYTRGEYDWKRLCARDDLDLVYTATPWNWHVPICLEAMKSGKHAATEVPAALTVEDCWKLVDTAEETGLYCQMMENCCYGRSELMVLNMVRQGVLGEIVHGECGYMHDLRGIKLGGSHEGDWRWKFSIPAAANNYPTHGLGPVAQCMDINRGDRFVYLTSMSSPPLGLNEWAQKHLAQDDPRRKNHYLQGDVNSSLIQTEKGRTIVLQHNCNLPRPYSRINIVEGTKGIFEGYPDRVYIEGVSPAHTWEEAEKYYPKYDHPLYKEMTDKSKGAGHGGMDYIEDYRMIGALMKGRMPDQDVYDAVAWSCIVELSQTSVHHKSKAVDFPDFTRGAWKTRKPLELVLS